MVFEPLSPDVILPQASGMGGICPLDEVPFGRRKGTCDKNGGLSHRQGRTGQTQDGEPGAGRMGIRSGNLRTFIEPGEDGIKELTFPVMEGSVFLDAKCPPKCSKQGQ